MIKPLPLPKVQQLAGHLDIKTTMRYVHGDIINETASLQLSRNERKNQMQDVKKVENLSSSSELGVVVPIKKGLRLVSSK